MKKFAEKNLGRIGWLFIDAVLAVHKLKAGENWEWDTSRTDMKNRRDYRVTVWYKNKNKNGNVQ